MHKRYQRFADIAIALGLGCFYAWFFLALKMLALCATANLSFAGRFAMLAAVIAAFGFVLLFSKRIFPVNKRFQPPFMPLAFVGMFLIAYNDQIAVAGSPLAVLGAICVGLEYGWLTIIWMELFSLLKAPRYIYQLVSGIFVAAALIAIASLLPFLAFVIVAASMPVISTAALSLSYWFLENMDQNFFTMQRRYKKDKAPPRFSLSAMRSSSGLFRLIMGAAATFSIYGFIFALVSSGFVESALQENIMRSIGFAVAGLLLFVSLLISRKRLVLSHLYWALQPIFIAGLLMLTVQYFFGEVLVAVSFMLMMVLCAIMVCEIGHRFETPVFHLVSFVFGIGAASCCLGTVAGHIYVLYVPESLAEEPYAIWVLIIGLTIFTALSSRHGGFSFQISKNDKKAVGAASVASEAAAAQWDGDFTSCQAAYFEALANRSADLGERHDLTAREVEILTLIAQSFSTEWIAEKLHLSPNTVKVHTHNILEKLEVHRRTDILDIIQNM